MWGAAKRADDRADPAGAGGPVCTIELVGHLTMTALEVHLGGIDPRPAPDGGLRILVDARAMSGYEPAAREEFIRWHTEHKRKIRREAIVTTNLMYHMVIAAMSMASRVPMKAFSDRDAALSWLEG